MKKFILSVVSIFCMVCAYAGNPSENVLIPSDKAVVRSLNGEWSFKFINGPEWNGFAGFQKPGYDVSSWDKIAVPGCWDAMGYLTAIYAHPEDVTGLYKTTFEIPDSWKGMKVFLNFDGVLRGYELWINGKSVGSWELANNTCQFDITKYVKKGVNDLAMRVYTRYKGYEFDGNDDWGQVGIHRNVTLFAVPRTHVKDMMITSTVATDNSAEVKFDFLLDGGNYANAVIKGEIRCPHNGLKDSFEYKAGKGSVSHVWKVARPHLWTAETPALYTVNYSVWQGGKQTETFTRKFGIREIRIEGNRLLLNNKLFKLRGVNTHATDPYNGKLISEELNLKDMRMMKEANVNFIRNSHYPREPRFYDLCDSLGFYVMDEVPFGYGDEHLRDSSYQDNLILRADATVYRDKNHPCIIIWSIGNENDLTEICQVTGKHVQQLDPTRPICYPMIGSYFNRQNFELPDFLDIFAPHYPSSSMLKSYAQKSYKPLIATEYCHTLGQSLEEHHEMWEVMQANDNLAGGAIWEWVDQGMPDRESVWPGKFAWTDRVWLSETDVIKMEGNQGTDGLLYPTRDPLPNYFNIRKNYAQAYVLTDKLTLDPANPVLEVEIENRYDFVNLKGKVNCLWKIDAGYGSTVLAGSVSPECDPHQRCKISIDASQAFRFIDDRLCVLTLTFVDMTNGLTVNEKSFVLNSDEQYAGIINTLKNSVNSARPASAFISGEPLWRSGRKPSIAEDLILTKKGGSYVTKYILKGSAKEDGQFRFANSEIAYDGTLNVSETGKNLAYEFSFKPDGEGKLLTEAGLALLLDKELRYFQWIGKGPYTSYPGKDNANEPGIHALQAGDLYFEGNKMGVDALLCTDKRGNGVLLIPEGVDNVNFEETDKGMLVSFNPVVSGMGRKGSITLFPKYSQDIESIDGKVLVIPVEAGKWKDDLNLLFRNPTTIGQFSPFISVYDTYLRKLEDVME